MTAEHGPGFRWRLVLAFAAIYVGWGSTYLAIRFGVETIPPFFLAGVRFLLAGSTLYLWSARAGAASPTARQWRDAAIVGGLMLLGGNGLVSWAETSVPSGIAALIIAVVPLFVAVFQWKRPTLATASGIALGFAGIAILVGAGAVGDAGRVRPLGALALVAASASWAAGSLYSRRADRPASSLRSAAIQMLAGGTLLIAAGTAGGQWRGFHPADVSAKSLASLLYLVVVGSIAGYTAYLWLLQVTTPDRAATYAYANPVIAVVLGWALAGEPLTWRVAAAGAVIIAAVALIVRGSRTARR